MVDDVCHVRYARGDGEEHQVRQTPAVLEGLVLEDSQVAVDLLAEGVGDGLGAVDAFCIAVDFDGEETKPDVGVRRPDA